MDVTAIVDNTITPFGRLFTLHRKRIYRLEKSRTSRRLAVAARNINDVVWLT
jgi:hypothetical protein